MRILHLIPHLSKGGAERQLSYLAPELARLGHDVHVAYSFAGPDKPELAGVALHQLKSRSSYDPYLLWQLSRLVWRIKPDIIHTWIFQMHILGGITAKLCGVPWIFHELGSSKSHTWKHRLRVHAGSIAKTIVSNSRGGDDNWKKQLPDHRRYIVANGLPLSEIEEIRAAMPFGFTEPDAPIVLYVGRLIALKNLEPFLRALTCFMQKRQVTGILCGEGPQRSELEILRHKLGLDGSVHFTGNLTAAAVWALMKKAAVFVSLSSIEGCPNTVMEAMACCCPLVLSDIPAHREILDESCALFVDPANVKETVAAIAQALRDTGASKSRALIAKQKTQEWTIAKMAQNFERVYYESSRKSK